MKKINYKSDFDFILKLVSRVKGEDGSVTKTEVGFPDHDWCATFWTSSKANAYVASRRGDVLTNCFNDNGQIHVVCNAHRLGVGELKCEYHAELPDAMYPDGSRDVYEPQMLDIELVTGQSDCPTELVAEMGLSVMYRSVYEDAVSAGFEGTQQEYYQRLTELPDSVEVAQTLRQSVEDISAMVSDTAAGKKRVLDALARRGYELPEDVSYNDMAETIENMEWGEGILAKIGYEGEEDYELLSQEIAQSYRAKQLYESDEVDSLYECGVIAPKVEIKNGNADYLFYDTLGNKGNTTLKYVPLYDGLTSCKSMFYNCSALKYIASIDTRNVTSTREMYRMCTKLKACATLDMGSNLDAYGMFAYCYALESILLENTGKITNFNEMFIFNSILATVSLLDFSSVASASSTFNNCPLLHTLCITNLGKSSLTSYSCFSPLSVWGSTDEGRQSLIDTLITNSYDRAAHGMSACKITLHANTKALLTEAELAAITAKGFTIA